MSCIGCEASMFAVATGASLFGVADKYADYAYRICLSCGLRVGRIEWTTT